MDKTVKENLFFIAIVPEEPLYSMIMNIKESFAKDYDSKAALRSPPHITLHMPFKLSLEKAGKLKLRLVEVLLNFSPFEVKLKNYGSFPHKVIFIQVMESESLTNLHSIIKRVMRTEFNFLNQDYKNQGFHPHITVAFRDMKKQEFNKAWEKFGVKNFEDQFACNSVFLLKHTGKIWEKYFEILLTQKQ